MDYTIEFKTNRAMLEINIDEGCTVPNSLLYVDMSLKSLTGESFIDETLGSPTKKFNECFYVTTINDKDYCAVGRCSISRLNNSPTGNWELLPDEIFSKWVTFWGAPAFLAPQDLPIQEV